MRRPNAIAIALRSNEGSPNEDADSSRPSLETSSFTTHATLTSSLATSLTSLGTSITSSQHPTTSGSESSSTGSSFTSSSTQSSYSFSSSSSTTSSSTIASTRSSTTNSSSSSTSSSDTSSGTTSVGNCPGSTAYLCYASNEQAPADLNIRVNFAAFATALPKDASTLQVARLEFFTGGFGSIHVLRVYNDNQGTIGSQDSETDFVTQEAAGWYGVEMGSAIEVSPQAPLWFAWFPAQNTYASQASSGSPVSGFQNASGNSWAPHSPLFKMRVYCCQ